MGGSSGRTVMLPIGGVTREARMASAAGPSLVATEIFLWLTRIPSCARSALSTLRTVCFGDTHVVVSTCTSDTSPVGPEMIRTFRTPGSVPNSSSAFSIGRTVPTMGEAPSSGRGAGEPGAFSCIAETVNKFLKGKAVGWLPGYVDRQNESGGI